MKRLGLLLLLFPLLTLLTFSSCSSENESFSDFSEMKKTGSMNLEYAEMFSVDFYENNISLVTIGKNEQYLIIPENTEKPKNISESITVIQQPVSDIYLAASSAMDLFNSIGAIDSISMTSTMEKDWSIPEIKEAISNEDIIYVGKYSAPDYEAIVEKECGLAIESTMIYHSPEIREQLEKMGIPVIVERSSYEAHPLGRMEWIKLYGLITGKTEQAESIFEEKLHQLDSFIDDESTGKTVAFFSITSNGYANIHKSGDYVSKMIEIAGGINALDDMILSDEENSLSTMNMQFESFYVLAKDADFLIYNSTIDGGISSIDELIAKNKLLADFKAVKNGNVWCTEKNMFQQSTGVADMIADMNMIFSESNQKPTYIYHLE